MDKSKETSVLKTKYFWGIGSLVARETGFSKKYCQDVLKGLHDERNTPAVKQIKKVAEQYKVA